MASLKNGRLRRLRPLAYVNVNSGFWDFKSLLRRQTTDLTVLDVGQPGLRWRMVRHEGFRFTITFALFLPITLQFIWSLLTPVWPKIVAHVI